MFIQVSKYRGEVSPSAEHTSISHSYGAGVVEGHRWSTGRKMSHKTAEHEGCGALKSLAPLSSICGGRTARAEGGCYMKGYAAFQSVGNAV